MDKNAIKKYAIWARRELIEKVSQKALQYGIEDGKELDPKLESINGVLLSDDEKKQRQALIRKINENGYAHVMEEVAYTWFNRFIALRFMEVNGYLPSHVRVFSDEAGEFKPQIMSEALHLDIEGLDMEKVYELKNDNRDDDLFKYLLITQCNALSGIFPKMFQKISDYTELLLPDYLLREGSVIEQMVNQKDGIPEADWLDQVQIIGWLYQFYNTDLKAKVFGKPKSEKFSKDEMPAATGLFTPAWIVNYMVENSLGRLWLEGHPNDNLKSEWKYYLDEAEQKENVQTKLDEIHRAYSALKPEEIRVIDPCSGSGHILCVIFDVLVRIYEDYGHTAREAATSIIKNNLWGLDIDERAAQLSYFTVMMKARQYDRRFLLKKDENGKPDIPQPHVYAIHETNAFNELYKQALGDFHLSQEHQNTLQYLFNIFIDAKEYGSVLKLEKRDYIGLADAWNLIWSQTANNPNMTLWSTAIAPEIPHLINQALALSQNYHVVVTNPPYMGSKQGMNDSLKKYLKKYYDQSRSDLYGVFMDVAYDWLLPNGFLGMINQHGWMFLSSFSKLREFVVHNTSITSMLHLGTHAFEEIGGEVVQTAAFTIRKAILNYTGKYVRLTDISDPSEKEKYVLDVASGKEEKNLYLFNMEYFKLLPDNLIGYWISTKLIDIFKNEKALTEIAKPRQGLSTSDNDRFLRLWFEPQIQNIGFGYKNRDAAAASGLKWFPYNKGGEYRKWYGNNNYVINWQYDGQELRAWADYLNSHGTSMGRLVSQEFYYKKGLTWSGVGATRFGVRCYPEGMLFDVGANGLFVDDELYYYLAGFLNTKIANEMIKVLNPTINTGSGTVGKLPIIVSDSDIEEINCVVKKCVSLVKDDWNSYETSWDFERNPLIHAKTIQEGYFEWQKECDRRFLELKSHEEQINKTFLRIYGLEKDFTPNILEEDVSIRKPNKESCVKDFIQYAVGCMFGRYSLDAPGLAFAGGEWDASKYTTFQPDKDAIIPICNDEYFEDDIVGCFVKFVEIVYGKGTLEENLRFIADALGGKGAARDVVRNYFINDFFTDHCNSYSITGSGKRPIYWLFDSGKKNGFKCLIYMHRYQPDTIARIRTDYVHEQQARYRTAIEEIEKRIDTVSASEKVKLSKKLNTLKAQDEEIHTYEEKIHHLADQMISIDLDDGVKHNYALFQDVLAKIK